MHNFYFRYSSEDASSFMAYLKEYPHDSLLDKFDLSVLAYKLLKQEEDNLLSGKADLSMLATAADISLQAMHSLEDIMHD